MIQNPKISLVFFLALTTIAGHVRASEEQPKEYKLYPQSIKKSKLPGHPPNDFLKTVISVQILPETSIALAHWKHEYRVDYNGEYTLFKSYFYQNRKVTVYTHHTVQN